MHVPTSPRSTSDHRLRRRSGISLAILAWRMVGGLTDSRAHVLRRAESGLPGDLPEGPVGGDQEPFGPLDANALDFLVDRASQDGFEPAAKSRIRRAGDPADVVQSDPVASVLADELQGGGNVVIARRENFG